MNKSSFLLGAGVGIVLTSLLLGLIANPPASAPEEIEPEGSISEQELRQLAQERGFHLIAAAEWKKLNEQSQEQEQREMIYIYIPRGFSWEETASVLKEANLVDDPQDVMQQLQEMKREKVLRPGLYHIPAGEPVPEIIDTLSRSKNRHKKESS